MTSLNEKLHHERRNYKRGELNLEDTSSDPFRQFDLWYKEAAAQKKFEANAMILSTVSVDMQPSSRVVLLKAYNHKGFQFFTNYNSLKGKNMAVNKNVSLLFFYEQMERQIRIEGEVIKLSDEENDEYFYSRPIESQYSAMASEQSSLIDTKENLLEQLNKLKAAHKKPQRPKHWGGYLVKANYFEFWQGRPNRLHDRISYKLNADEQWDKNRLAP